MGTSYNPYSSSPLPINGRSFIAAYWGDVDLRGIGEVYYRQTASPILLARANNEIQRAFINHQNVTISNLFIATWDTVGYFPNRTDRVRLVYIIVLQLLSIVSHICLNESFSIPKCFILPFK